MSTVDKFKKILKKYEHPEYNLTNFTSEEPINTIEQYWDDNNEPMEKDYITEEIKDLPTYIRKFNSGQLCKTIFFEGKQLTWIDEDLFKHIEPTQSVFLLNRLNRIHPIIEIEDMGFGQD